MDVNIGPGVLAQLPATARRLMQPGARLVVLFDPTTYRLFGEAVMAPLSQHALDARELVLGVPDQAFEPDDRAVTLVTDFVRDGQAVLLGVGSGAINDLGKYVSAQAVVPYISVATAPSMDGFAAPISAIMVDKVKTTLPSRSPDAVVGDIQILASAPAHLISAGFGDVLGKMTSLLDWKLAQILLDEPWCGETAAQVGHIAAHVASMAEGIHRRQPEQVGELMTALVRAGAAVSHVGNSRPTSGAEHLVSHFVEMWHTNRALRPPLHGHVVGIGTLCTARIVEELAKLDKIADAGSEPLADPGAVLEALRIGHMPDNFGKAKFDRQRAVNRTGQIRGRWQEARAVLRTLPSAAKIESLLHAAGCPTRFAAIGIEKETVRQTLSWARFLRERYTLLDLAAEDRKSVV